MKIENNKEQENLHFVENCKNCKNQNKITKETIIISGIIIDRNHYSKHVKENDQNFKKNKSEIVDIYVY